ncbi:hypothetical protein BC831DRAFT_444811, partial [Entophlyctis helioformis]
MVAGVATDNDAAKGETGDNANTASTHRASLQSTRPRHLATRDGRRWDLRSLLDQAMPRQQMLRTRHQALCRMQHRQQHRRAQARRMRLPQGSQHKCNRQVHSRQPLHHSPDPSQTHWQALLLKWPQQQQQRQQQPVQPRFRLWHRNAPHHAVSLSSHLRWVLSQHPSTRLAQRQQRYPETSWAPTTPNPCPH